MLDRKDFKIMNGSGAWTQMRQLLLGSGAADQTSGMSPTR